ncbi:MAG: hypothetical protein HY833_02905 [Candidatus Aenigmarchaeota archaeon]|nr:hypothetical protein [Candidatus Aenigmarchaeota archaeon]
MGKGTSSMISSVIVVLISVAGVSAVLMFGLPALDHSRASAELGDAQRSMLILDNAIRDTASGGEGSVREVALQVSGGSYRIADGRVEYRSEAPEGFLEGSSLIVNGKIRLNLTYSNISVSGDLRLGQGLQRVCLEKAGWNGTHVSVNATAC